MPNISKEMNVGNDLIKMFQIHLSEINKTPAEIKIINYKKSKGPLESIIREINSKGQKVKLPKKFQFYNSVQDYILGRISNSDALLKDMFNGFVNDGLYGRARERGRHAFLIDFHNTELKSVLLLQTKKIEFQLKEKRLSDGTIKIEKDTPWILSENIYRFAYIFSEPNDNNVEIYLKYWQKTYSGYFLDWLRVDEKSKYKAFGELKISFIGKFSMMPIRVDFQEEIFGDLNSLEQKGITLNTGENSISIKNAKVQIEEIRFNP